MLDSGFLVLDSGLREVVAYDGTSLTVRPNKWSRSLAGGGRLLEVPTVTLWLRKFWCLG